MFVTSESVLVALLWSSTDIHSWKKKKKRWVTDAHNLSRGLKRKEKKNKALPSFPFPYTDEEDGDGRRQDSTVLETPTLAVGASWQSLKPGLDTYQWGNLTQSHLTSEIVK